MKWDTALRSEPAVRLSERLFFGKLPCRGDFLRSDRHRPVLQSLDDWMSQTMDRLAPDPRWKLTYDAAQPVDFAILSVRGARGLVGHWTASQDASGRRFPFVTASVIDVDTPSAFVVHSPLALSTEWFHLTRAAHLAHTGESPEAAMQALQSAGGLPSSLALAPMQSRLEGFLAQHTVASLEQMLVAGGVRLSLRQALLALGLLLQPVMSQGVRRLSRVLCLPLSGDPALRPEVAAFWLSLIVGFFERSDAELALFMVAGGTRPSLMLGFQGASAASLHAVIDPQTQPGETVSLQQSEWVESSVAEDWGLRKLSNYLQDPGLSLLQARDTYREVFMGV